MPDEYDALHAWLAARLELTSPTQLELSVARPNAGESSDTLVVSATWPAAGTGPGHLDLVIKLEPADPLFPDARITTEAEVVARLASSDVPVPTVRWIEPDPRPLGRPFFVMDRCDGIVLAGKPSIHRVGWLTTLSPEERDDACTSGLWAMAAVHAVDWPRSHQFLAELRGTLLSDHVGWLTHWHQQVATGRSFPVLEAGLSQLASEVDRVRTGSPVLVWGDARPGNLLYASPRSVAAVLDWELARIGPRGIDLGYWLFMDDFHAEGQGVARLPGWPTRAEIIGRYRALSGGGEVHDLGFFELAANVFLAISLVPMTDRRIRAGQLEPTSRAAHDNTVTQMLARKLDLPEPDLSPDFARWRNPASTTPS